MHQLLASEIAEMIGKPSAFANANAGSKLFVCATQQNDDLDVTGFELLPWVEIKGVGSHGEAGSNTNMLTYDQWDSDVVQKAKGMTDAGSPEIELARIFNDPGQNILRAAALQPFNYAFKMVRNDKTQVNGTSSIIYNRGLVTGPKRPFGRNEDFDLEVFTLGLNQREVVQNPTLIGTVPIATALPTITGTVAVGNVLTGSNGTFSGSAITSYMYQWHSGGVAIEGATSNQFVVTSAQQGKTITFRVRAQNIAGVAVVFSAPTILVP